MEIQTNQRMRISFDMCYPDSSENLFKLLDEICKAHDAQIVGLIPIGPGGGWPEVTFEADEENLKSLTGEWLKDSGDDVESYFETYSKRA